LDLALDHIGVIGHDLTSAAARWERLGFTLAPLSRQRGAVPGHAGVQPWVIVVGEDARLAARLVALDAIPRLMASADFAARFDWRPQAPCFAAITIAFADLDRTLRLLAGRGVVPRRNGVDLWLAPEATNGFVMRLVQHA